MSILGITILFFAFLWTILSIKIVGPDEMAILVLFGRPISFCDSGFCFVPYLPGLKCYIRRYPKKMYNFNYSERTVVSQTGKYKEVEYGALILKVDAVAYLNFPREPEENIGDKTHPLIKILRSGVPIEDEKLQDWTDDAVIGALRIAFGQMTWRQAIEDMKLINEKVEDIFKDIDGALIKAGFRPKGIKLVVAEIKLPKEIESVLSNPDKARLNADAAKKVAEQTAVESAGALIKMLSENTGMSVDDIQKAIKENPNEFAEKYGNLIADNLDLLRRKMALNENALVDIRVDGAKGLEKSLLNLLALFQRTPKGGGGDNKKRSGDSSEDEDKTSKDKKKYLSPEEGKKIYKKTQKK
jgi:regulator of protease activity HflC (stomatin/prohibitin superfamily)